MSWLFGNKNKNTSSSQTNLQAHRTKQIDSLKKANLNPIEVIPNTEYRITFASGGINITLVVGVVGRPPFPPATTSMSSFTASGGMPEYYQSPGGHFGTNQTESMQVAENSSEESLSLDKVPDVFAAFPDLKTKSLTELFELQDEEDKILEMIQKLPHVTKFAEEREKISNECIELARANLSYKPVLEQHRQWILEKKNLYQKTEEEFQRNQQRLMSKSEDFHPSVIQNNLKVALMEAEEESENIVEQFLEIMSCQESKGREVDSHPCTTRVQ
uniref:Vacuolar protein sorting-associated protein 37A n=1 Tax=Magallana gigas TaxID=29159 RepID=K1RAX7_MAGGI